MEKFRSYVYLIFTFFGLGFLIMCPFLIYEVYQAKDATPLKAKVTYSEYGEDSDSCWMSIEYLILDSENTVEISDYQPGDFAMCFSRRAQVKENKKGELTDIYITKNGDYYASKGSFKTAIILSTLSLLWYVHLFYLARRNKKRDS